jgi:hypothetical protein
MVSRGKRIVSTDMPARAPDWRSEHELDSYKFSCDGRVPSHHKRLPRRGRSDLFHVCASLEFSVRTALVNS